MITKNAFKQFTFLDKIAYIEETIDKGLSDLWNTLWYYDFDGDDFEAENQALNNLNALDDFIKRNDGNVELASNT